METQKVVCPECHSVNAISTAMKDAQVTCSQCQGDLSDPFPLDVSDEQCSTHIKENEIPIIVDFYSPGCGPCMAMYDDYEDAALGFPMKVRFLKVNADKHQKVAKEYGVGGLPTLIAFKNGQEVSRVSAQMSQVQLSLWAEGLLK
ncbi:thioredoxin fold domain-containing protein [Sulfurimonas aquatica]|uniref:Thioredoxin fold domain-containing protein n=1 Tax=Sulfurimonas aquatica TaxID=2672570 RepID=A0A975GCY5_9BACT|nr:thioredoxin domain-containing protein [Sulfurimonas aquatica]QSZ41754.1 thioredoxin fold domain-containing protein [Sulfurimonas aquatica]